MLSDIKNKPVSILNLFKLSFSVFVQHFFYIFCVYISVYLPLYITFEFFPQRFVLTQNDLLTQNIDKILICVSLKMGILIVFAPLATAAMTTICQNSVEGKKLNFATILDNSLIKWPKLFCTSLIFTAMLIFSSISIILPVYLGVCFVFCLNIIAVTDKWGFSALFASWGLVRGNWWRTAAMLFMINGLSIIIAESIGIIVYNVFSSINPLLSIVIQTGIDLLTSYFQIVFTLYFLNLLYTKTNKPWVTT